MKRSIFYLLTAVALVLTVASCNKKPDAMDNKTGKNVQFPEGGMRIAFVNVDSVQNNYALYKLISDSLSNMDLRRQNVLADKAKQLERSYNSIQTRLQNNGFTSEDQYKTAVAAFEQERNNRVALEARLTNELAQKQADFLQTLQDSLDSFLAEYNKDKKYDMILNKATVLFSDKKYDITQDVINGLNQRYKK